jgi:CBS domain-containing membrane protein
MSEPRQQPSLLDRLAEAEAELSRELIRTFRLAPWLERFPARLVWAVFTFLSGFITIALLAGVAMLSGTSFIFPSLGPTAFLFFFNPREPASTPRNAIYGHALGILCGWGALWLTGLENAGPALAEGVHARRVLAAALSLAATGALMILCRVAHPPAAATTLIVSLGIITDPWHLLIVEVAVVLMALQAVVINRLAGLDYPLWAARPKPAAPVTANRLPPP